MLMYLLTEKKMSSLSHIFHISLLFLFISPPFLLPPSFSLIWKFGFLVMVMITLSIGFNLFSSIQKFFVISTSLSLLFIWISWNEFFLIANSLSYTVVVFFICVGVIISSLSKCMRLLSTKSAMQYWAYWRSATSVVWLGRSPWTASRLWIFVRTSYTCCRVLLCSETSTVWRWVFSKIENKTVIIFSRLALMTRADLLWSYYFRWHGPC